MKIGSGCLFFLALAFIATFSGDTAGAQSPAPPKPRPTTGPWHYQSFATAWQLSGHTVLWTGQKVLVWGGRQGGWNNQWPNSQNFQFDPVDWSFTPMSSEGAPIARYDHTAVWTGSKMIVWGGLASSLAIDSGGIYDPATNTWSPMSIVNRPAARFRHTAIWTGSKMIIWGGIPSMDYPYNNGKIYDPATDTWSAMAASPLTGRGQHTAVWTGSKMIVWGGSRGVVDFMWGTISGVYNNDGAAYDPATDQWTSLPAAPLAGRDYHFACWTGSEMVVLGGSNGSTVFADGAAYNPVQNTWRALNLPSQGRTRTSGGYTGSKLLVWGGLRNGAYLEDGMKIDPAANNWEPMENENGVPTSRFEHQSVWTDYGLVIMGGLETDYNRAGSWGIYKPPLTTSGSRKDWQAYR